jgi:hypothetical protein
MSVRVVEFFRLITEMPSPFNMVVLVVLFATVGTVIKAIAKYIRQYASHRQELALKREMLERGMSAGEIEQVIRARSPSQATES